MRNFAPNQNQSFMSDALWNGFIGAGGAAICCAVYFGTKGLIHIAKKATKPKIGKMAEIESTDGVQEGHSFVETNKRNRIVINLPSKGQLFTRQNIRASLFLIISFFSIYWAFELAGFDSWSPQIDWISFEGEFYNHVVENQRTNIVYLSSIEHTIEKVAYYWFWLVGLIFFALGITGFSFKKK